MKTKLLIARVIGYNGLFHAVVLDAQGCIHRQAFMTEQAAYEFCQQFCPKVTIEHLR